MIAIRTLYLIGFLCTLPVFAVAETTLRPIPLESEVTFVPGQVIGFDADLSK